MSKYLDVRPRMVEIRDEALGMRVSAENITKTIKFEDYFDCCTANVVINEDLANAYNSPNRYIQECDKDNTRYNELNIQHSLQRMEELLLIAKRGYAKFEESERKGKWLYGW